MGHCVFSHPHCRCDAVRWDVGSAPSWRARRGCSPALLSPCKHSWRGSFVCRVPVYLWAKLRLEPELQFPQGLSQGQPVAISRNTCAVLCSLWEVVSASQNWRGQARGAAPFALPLGGPRSARPQWEHPGSLGLRRSLATYSLILGSASPWGTSTESSELLLLLYRAGGPGSLMLSPPSSGAEHPQAQKGKHRSLA